MGVELLSPAGNPEKLRAAVLYGADAVYLAGRNFGMRSAAGNFSNEELAEAVRYAHQRGVRVYLAVNTMPRTDEYPALEKYFEAISDFGIDAFIAADIGVISLLREKIPGAEIHISTQANTVSARTAYEWYRLGAKRVVLAREVTLNEIREMRKNIPDDLELEAFIHGSMCISYSGRCLLSGFLADRDANRGRCAQPCRWNYTISGSLELREEKRPDVPLPIEQINGETFIMASRDMCMIEHIPELMESGINSFKIEGRMRSAYYTAAVTNVYRMAIDSYLSGNYKYDPLWAGELESVSHREYSTGYFFADSHSEANTCRENGYIREKAYIATVEEYNSVTGEALLIQKNKVSAGETAELLSPGRTGIPFVVEALYDEEHEPIPSAPHPGMRFYMKSSVPMKCGDIVRAAER